MMCFPTYIPTAPVLEELRFGKKKEPMLSAAQLTVGQGMDGGLGMA
jgi:hypothetical protein